MVRVDVFVLQTDCGRLVLSRVKDFGQASLHQVQTFHQVLPVSRDFFRSRPLNLRTYIVSRIQNWLVTMCVFCHLPLLQLVLRANCPYGATNFITAQCLM